jgi:drug/metabolite transporter (DMT)-like permease
MDNIQPQVWAIAHSLVARNETNSTSSASSTTEASRPPVYKAIGLSLAIASGLFIGTSFVLKKTGLLKANEKYNEEAGEGYGYLKNFYWWTGMTLMIVGEICNFVAYAFVDAILVTPLGALSVVVTTILSAYFLKERLSFVGKVGCFNCIVGSVVIVLNAPEQSSVADIQEMQHFVIAPGFLSYAGVIILLCTFIALWVAPRYAKKSMLVYLSICSLIGGLSVVATQGLGSAVVAQASGKPQFNHWFLYVLLVFVVATLLTEIVYLNVSEATRHVTRALTLFAESFESLQCRPGDADLLCVLHKRDHHYVGHPVSWLQRKRRVNHHCRHGLYANLCRGGALADVQIRQRRPRRCCLQGRPGSSSRDRRDGAARIRAQGRCHSGHGRLDQKVIDFTAEVGARGGSTIT